MHPKSSAVVLCLAASAGLLLLPACGPKGAVTTPQAGGTPASSAGWSPARASEGAISLADLPRPKAGLWKIVVDDGDGQPMTMTECYSGAAPAMKAPENCAKMSFTRDATGALVADFDCGNDRMRVAEHMVGRGDYQSQMMSDGQMTVTVQGRPPKVSKVHSVSTRVGDCPPGAKLDSPDVAG